MKYLQSLRSSDKFSLQLTDIGVITPYRKQVCTFISCLMLFPLVVDRKVKKKKAGKLTRVPICARKFHDVVILFIFCLFVRSFPLISFSFAPRRSLREISKRCFRFKSYSIGSNPYYSRAHLMATSLQHLFLYLRRTFHTFTVIFIPLQRPPLHNGNDH